MSVGTSPMLCISEWGDNSEWVGAHRDVAAMESPAMASQSFR